MSCDDTDNQPPEHDDVIIYVVLQRSLIAFGVLAIAVGIVVFWWTWPDPDIPDKQTQLVLPRVRPTEDVQLPFVPFTNIARRAGIKFVHENGAYGDKLLPETMGGGCAFLDYDNDGDQDLLLVNSSNWPWDPRPAEAVSTTMGFFENDGAGQFTDITTRVGLDFAIYGMGAAVGDYDNDGDVDLFITAVGENRLLRNDMGRFVDVSDTAGVAGSIEQWSTSCAFADFENDGDLDLFVCNYVEWSQDIDLKQGFRLVGLGRAYGPPTAFEGTFPCLYRNEGNGQFTDVSSPSGVQQLNLSTGVPLAKSLGVAPLDIDGDSYMDLVVANDTVRNLVFHNQGDGTFREIGVELGVAFDASGKARGAMGIDVARFRQDDTWGIAIANFANEMTALYVSSDANLLFTDDAIPTGLGPPTRLELSFGLYFFDYDLDGRLDILAANGHLESDIYKVQESQRYRQPARLFWNAGPAGRSEFVSVTSENCGADLHEPIVGRGAAYADIDGDGDLDVLLTQIAGPPLLLRNDQQLGHHFLRFKLIGSKSNRDAIGAWICVELGPGRLQRQVMPTRSYLSQVELPVTIGIGEHKAVDRVMIQWPDGSTQEVLDYRLDGLTVVKQQ